MSLRIHRCLIRYTLYVHTYHMNLISIKMRSEKRMSREFVKAIAIVDFSSCLMSHCHCYCCCFILTKKNNRKSLNIFLEHYVSFW